LQDQIALDIRFAWLNANSGLRRLPLVQQFLAEVNQAADLAHPRYTIGISSITELSQAQLNHTQPQIEQASTKYRYDAFISAVNFQTGSSH
jgi:outer membrane protein